MANTHTCELLTPRGPTTLLSCWEKSDWFQAQQRSCSAHIVSQTLAFIVRKGGKEQHGEDLGERMVGGSTLCRDMGRILLEKRSLLCSTAFSASLPPPGPLRLLSYGLFGAKKPKPIHMISGERCIIKYGTSSSNLVVGSTPGPPRH